MQYRLAELSVLLRSPECALSLRNSKPDLTDPAPQKQGPGRTPQQGHAQALGARISCGACGGAQAHAAGGTV